MSKTVTDEWVYASKRGKVTHLIKKETRTIEGTEYHETVCGRVVDTSAFRPAQEYSSKCMKCWRATDPDMRTIPLVTPLEVAKLETSKMQKFDGFVYCMTHTVIHEDTTDPYMEHEPTCLTEANGTGIGVKKEDVHRSVYVRWKAGDYPDSE